MRTRVRELARAVVNIVPAGLVAVSLTLPATAGAQPSASSPPSSQSATTEREAGGHIVITGDTVVVVGDPDVPADTSSIASKVETPVIETPRSVSVTERRTLDDRLAVSITNAHDYTAGLLPADERGPAYARGFLLNFYDLRRDGLRTYAWSVREPVGVERIQYLRGPAAILYGDGSPGGLVNMVLRKPLPESQAEFTASGGTLGFGRFTGDVTGPVDDGRRVRYRLIGAGEWLGNGYHNDERRLSFLPALSLDLGRTATVTVDSEFYHQQGRNYRHTVPVTADTQRGDFSKSPWDLSVAGPDDGWSGWNVSPGIRLDMQIGADATLHSAFRYTRIGGELDFDAPLSLASDGRSLNRFRYAESSTWTEWQADTFVTTAARTGSVGHTLVVGAESGLSTADTLVGIAAAPPLDIYDPVYAAGSAPSAFSPSRYDVVRLGIYAQDQIRLLRSLIVVPGLRWTRVTVDDKVARPAITGAEQVSDDTRLSPSLGVVVLPRPWLSFYANASRGFEPPGPGQYLEDGRALALADVSSTEGGVKVDAAGRVTASATVFGIRRTNIPEADGLGFFRQIGEGRSRGIETELAGRVGPGLFLQAAYAWTDTEITSALVGGVGNDLPNAPRHAANAWARYRVTAGRLAGAMVGAGIVHVGDRYLDASNVVVAPAYTRLDLSASYAFDRQRLRVGVGLLNATNRRYVMSGAGQVLWVGQPRRFVVQAGTSF